jgi:hypothetical protein
MLLLSYALNGQSVSIGLDAAIRQTHNETADITSHQVETGLPATDNIRPLPFKITIEGMVTNTPVVPASTQMRGATGRFQSTDITVQQPGGKTTTRQMQALVFSAEFDRVRDVYSDLVDAKNAGALFTVDTTLKHYENMAISSINLPVDAQSGSSITFTIEMQEVRIVETQTVAAPAAKARQKTQKNGDKPPKEVTDPQQKKSFAKAGASAVAAWGH